MPSAPSPRTICLIVSNVLILLAIGIFASGFFPYKPFLPGLASFTDTEKELEALLGVSHGVPQRPRRVFDKVVFMVVDALRRYVEASIGPMKLACCAARAWCKASAGDGNADRQQ